MKDPRDIIVAPVVSEKSYELMEAGVYTFKVHPQASKPEIVRDAEKQPRIAGRPCGKIGRAFDPGERLDRGAEKLLFQIAAKATVGFLF